MKADASSLAQKRLKILDDDEIGTLYGRPIFTPAEQVEYFALAPPEKAVMEQLHSLTSRLFYILQLGYFKACHLFFVFTLDEVAADASYVQTQYFPAFSPTDLQITKVTRLKQQRLILDLCQYRLCGAAERQQLEAKARSVAKVCSKPIYVFRELMAYLTEQRIVVPGYSTLQDMIGSALSDEQNRLLTLVDQQLDAQAKTALKHLLADTAGLYEITRLKQEPKDFTLGEIKAEIERGQQLRPLYQRAKQLLPALNISNESIKYYASLVTYYSVFRLKQLDEQLVTVYLLCFIYHRYQRLNDNLLKSLLYKISGYLDEAKAAAKEQVYAYQMESNQNLQKAGQVLQLFTDETIAEATPFQAIRAKAFTILDRQQLAAIADRLATNASFDETAFQWHHLDRLAPQFKRNVRLILSNIELVAAQTAHPLLEAVYFLKQLFQAGKALGQAAPETFPTRFIPEPSKRYLYEQDAQGQKYLRLNRYEFLVYRLLRNSLEAGEIFCRESVQFRSFEEDLLDDRQWQKKETLLISTGLTSLQQASPAHLAALEQTLEERLTRVNQRIAAGENEHFQRKSRGQLTQWALHYPASSEPVNHPLFDSLRQVEIGTVLHFVNRHCHFMDAFVHVLGRYAKQESDDRILTACLVAWGTNMGLGKMSEISDIGLTALVTASDNFIRLETLSAANDRISNTTAALPIFRHYDLGETVHSSSDGQKFETRRHTLNARYAPKYFGLNKGVVAYTLVANHIPINARIIGANEHESHFVFDLLFNNTTDIHPTVHSTDTHGANEINFAILHLFGYQFAPRYQDLPEKVRTALYGFKHPSQYEHMLLKPIRKLNTDLILEEWENIQRIMLSLALKTTTQNIIVGKLSAFPRQNKTKRALWEYDNIIRSLYLLEYIDSPPLRRHVQQALNRGESYHQLRRAISHANFGKLRFKTEYEQQIWNECGRLIANCIIHYNATILSSLLERKAGNGDPQAVAFLKHTSPVAWQHINLQGRFEFNKRPEDINLDAIIHELSQRPLPQQPPA